MLQFFVLKHLPRFLLLLMKLGNYSNSFGSFVNLLFLSLLSQFWVVQTAGSSSFLENSQGINVKLEPGAQAFFM